MAQKGLGRVFALQVALVLACVGCLTHIKISYRHQKSEDAAVQQLAVASQQLWGRPAPPTIALDENPAKLLKLATTHEDAPMEDTHIPGNGGGDQGEKTHFLHYNHAPPISKVAGEVHQKLDNTREHLMNEMKRWGKVGGDAAPAPKEEDEASASPPAPATQAMTGSSSLSTQIAAQKKMLAQLKQEAKAKKLPAKAKKLKASKQEKLKAKKAAQLKVLEAKVAAAKQKLAGASRTAPTRESAPVPAPATGDALAQMKQASAKARAKFKSKMDKWNAEDSEDDPLDSKKAVAADEVDEQILLAVRSQIESQLDSAANSAAATDGDKLRSISALKTTLHHTLNQYVHSQRSEARLEAKYHQQELDEPEAPVMKVDDSETSNPAALAAATELHTAAVNTMSRKPVAPIVLALKSAEKQTNALKQASGGWKKYYSALPVKAKKIALHSVTKSELAMVTAMATKSELAATKAKKKIPAWKKMLDEQLGTVAKDSKEVKEVKANVMHGVKGVKHDHNSWDHYFSTR